MKKISYIGYSQGTAQMFIGIAEDPEFFKENLNVFAALAPLIVIRNPKSVHV